MLRREIFFSCVKLIRFYQSILSQQSRTHFYASLFSREMDVGPKKNLDARIEQFGLNSSYPQVHICN